MTAAVEATLEMAGPVLGCEARSLGANPFAARAERPGAYIGLTGPDESVQIGLVSRPEGLQALAKAMLGMFPDDEDLPPSDVADAVGEIANIFAGGVKCRMLPRYGSLTLGLPLFIHGYIEPTEKLSIQGVDLQIGDIEASLLVIRGREVAP